MASLHARSHTHSHSCAAPRACGCTQVAIRAQQKMNALTTRSFKYSTTWYVVERSSPHMLWSCSLLWSHPSVVAYQVRKKQNYPPEFLLDHTEVFQQFVELWEAEVIGKDDDRMPKNDGKAGAAHPPLEEVHEFWKHVRGAC